MQNADGVDAGKIQVDVALLSALLSAGVTDANARELARVDAFGGAGPTSAWINGLRAATRLFLRQAVNLDWTTLPEPWHRLGPILSKPNGRGPDGAFLDSTSHLQPAVQQALLGAISDLAAAIVAEEQALHPAGSTKPIAPDRASTANDSAQYLRPVDPDLVAVLQRLLRGKGPRDQRRKAAGEQLVQWLATHGRFIHVPVTGALYYLHRDSRQLFNLDSDIWNAWLYKATAANPASTDFRYLAADCRTAASDGENVSICRLAHWDGQLLRVSRFDGIVYRLDGNTIEVEANGDGPVVFEDKPYWIPYTPSFDSPSLPAGAIDWWLGILHCEGDPELYRIALRTWLLALFFTELCPTQVLLVLKGEAGSGKSMLLRVLMRLLFGPVAQISGIPDKPDGFVAGASNTHLLVLDNLDEPTDWLRDKLARITTGSEDHYRRLYTNNDLGTVIYRCWVAITARTPDTLRRDDLADRLLIVPVARIDEHARRRESSFLAEAMSLRSAFWGELLTQLNTVVASIRREGVPTESTMRMADFEALGRAIARANEQEADWERVVKEWGSQSSQFLLEDSLLTEALDTWLQNPGHRGLRLDSRTLFQELGTTLFGTNRPDPAWPRSSRSFGRTLKALRRSLQSRFDVRWWDTPDRTYYEFDLKH